MKPKGKVPEMNGPATSMHLLLETESHEVGLGQGLVYGVFRRWLVAARQSGSVGKGLGRLRKRGELQMKEGLPQGLKPVPYLRAFAAPFDFAQGGLEVVP